MNKWIIIAVIVVLLGGGGYFAYTTMGSEKADNNANTTAPAASVTTDNNGAKSIASLLKAGKSTVCTFTQESDAGNQDWTIQIDGKKFRGDYTVQTTEAGSLTGHVINDGNVMYMWSDVEGNKTGIKTTLTDEQKQSQEGLSTSDLNDVDQKSIDYSQELDMKCKNARVDAGQFVPPTDVTFMDLAEQIKNAGDSLNASSVEFCSVCDSLTGDAKTQCKSTYNCK